MVGEGVMHIVWQNLALSHPLAGNLERQLESVDCSVHIDQLTCSLFTHTSLAVGVVRVIIMPFGEPQQDFEQHLSRKQDFLALLRCVGADYINLESSSPDQPLAHV